jgi:hypothetical protein
MSIYIYSSIIIRGKSGAAMHVTLLVFLRLRGPAPLCVHMLVSFRPAPAHLQFSA